VATVLLRVREQSPCDPRSKVTTPFDIQRALPNSNQTARLTTDTLWVFRMLPVYTWRISKNRCGHPRNIHVPQRLTGIAVVLRRYWNDMLTMPLDNATDCRGCRECQRAQRDRCPKPGQQRATGETLDAGFHNQNPN